MVAPDMSFWLGRKYALLQQQADATTKNAATGELTGKAAARVDNTRANLMPAESMANIAKSTAETGLLGTQTKWFGPEAQARIGNLNANAYATRIGGDVTAREGLYETPTTDESQTTIRGMRMPTMGGARSTPMNSYFKFGSVLGN